MTSSRVSIVTDMMLFSSLVSRTLATVVVVVIVLLVYELFERLLYLLFLLSILIWCGHQSVYSIYIYCNYSIRINLSQQMLVTAVSSRIYKAEISSGRKVADGLPQPIIPVLILKVAARHHHYFTKTPGLGTRFLFCNFCISSADSR